MSELPTACSTRISQTDPNNYDYSLVRYSY